VYQRKHSKWLQKSKHSHQEVNWIFGVNSSLIHCLTNNRHMARNFNRIGTDFRTVISGYLRHLTVT
jgi:hypothetical protein